VNEDVCNQDEQTGGISKDMKSVAMELSNGHTASQKNRLSSHEMDSDNLQQRISDFIYQSIESRQVELDFEIDHVDKKILIKVINKISGKSSGRSL
jgi:uncharacterized FlaG/YvyC family protein